MVRAVPLARLWTNTRPHFHRELPTYLYDRPSTGDTTPDRKPRSPSPVLPIDRPPPGHLHALVAAASPNPDLSAPTSRYTSCTAAAAAERHSVGRPVSPAIAIPSPVHRYVHLPTDTVTVHRLYHRCRLIGADCTQRAVIVIRVRPARPHISIFTPWPSTPFSRPTDDCPILACPGLTEHTGPTPESIINDHERFPSPCPLHRPGSSNYPLLPLDIIEFTSTTIHAVSPSRRPTPKPFIPPSRN